MIYAWLGRPENNLRIESKNHELFYEVLVQKGWTPSANLIIPAEDADKIVMVSYDENKAALIIMKNIISDKREFKRLIKNKVQRDEFIKLHDLLQTAVSYESGLCIKLFFLDPATGMYFQYFKIAGKLVEHKSVVRT